MSIGFPGGVKLRPVVVLLLAGFLMTAQQRDAKANAEAKTELDAWRAEKDAEMRGPDSPLGRSAPLFLRPGLSRVGSDPSDQVRFESAGVPASAFELLLDGNRLTLRPLVPLVALNGQPATPAVLKPGDLVEVGPLMLRYQGGNVLSVQNAANPALLAYRGLHYLPVDWHYRVEATFEPAVTGKTLVLDTTTGGNRELPLKGVLHFQLFGKPYTLEGFLLGDRPDDLFVIFRDAGNGTKTYGAGRFLWVKGPVEGRTVVDFNQAWNPLCSYSDGFNCPLAPPENRLPVEVPVGEANYHR
jgi:uncharacterized protein (DUF1684 family)